MSRKHKRTIRRLALTAALAQALASAAPLALAQHASDNPVVSADDAFGLTLGLESTGIYQPPKWHRVSIDLGVYHFGIVPAAVNDAYYDGAITALNVGARYKFTLLGAPATLRVQSGNVTNTYFWNIAFSPGFFEFPPRSVLAYLTVDLS